MVGFDLVLESFGKKSGYWTGWDLFREFLFGNFDILMSLIINVWASILYCKAERYSTLYFQSFGK